MCERAKAGERESERTHSRNERTMWTTNGAMGKRVSKNFEATARERSQPRREYERANERTNVCFLDYNRNRYWRPIYIDVIVFPCMGVWMRFGFDSRASVFIALRICKHTFGSAHTATDSFHQQFDTFISNAINIENMKKGKHTYTNKKRINDVRFRKKVKLHIIPM